MALNKAADADTVYWSLAGCTRVPRPGMSGGLWLGGASRRTVAGGLGVTPT